MKRTFQALTTIVSVTIDDDLPIGELASLVLDGHASSDRDPELVFELRARPRPTLVCAGHYETPADDPFDLVSVLELDLYHAVAERAAPGWLLHAAALERDGRALVLAGPSGAGKTTLTLALLDRGFRIATEEMVLIDRDRVVRGLARPLHAIAGSPQHRAFPSRWRQHDYPLRGAAAGVRGVIAQPAASERITAPLPLGALVRIAHGPELAPGLAPLPPATALAQLWPCSLRQDDAGLAAATAIVSACSARALASRSATEAVDLLLTGLNY